MHSARDGSVEDHHLRFDCERELNCSSESAQLVNEISQ